MYNQIDSNKRKTVILIIIFVIVVLLIGWVFSQATESGYAGVGIAGIVAIVMSIGGYFKGDKVALMAAGAKGPVEQAQNPYLYRMVENLCITAGLPLPKIHIIPDPAINAFACGRNPDHASIAVTQGAIDKLENEELEGVLAHEMSHIKNYDILLMTIILVLVGLLALLSDWFIRFRFYGGGQKRSGGDSGGKLQLILIIAGVILLIISPIIGKLIQLAISRKREFLADASASLLTRYPAGLANALEKINQESLPLKNANNATAHLYIAAPFGQTKHFMAKLFSTHPPIQERIAALRGMA